MPGALTISLSREPLDSGSGEERATFGLFSMTANGRLLTADEDVVSGALRHGPHVAGCPAAEWLVWNWWRLRWECASPSEPRAARRWDFAHRMSSIGEGYAWPNVTIHSDGLRSMLHSEPSRNPGAVAFRHIGAAGRETAPASSLEAAIDGFVEEVLARLEGRRLRATNLHRLWDDLRAEREDPEAARFRRLEARLGCDPDEADEEAIRRHLDDAAELGEEALGELADDAGLRGAPGAMMSARDVRETAARAGFDADPAAAALVDGPDMPQPGTVEAWRAGYDWARKLRDRERLDGAPIADARLADLAGTTTEAVARPHRRAGGPSFTLDGPDGRARLVLRSKWKTGRRFELARLIGDRVLGAAGGRPAERLFPATRAYGYRQKAQRAFAAELLSPFGAVEDMLDGDYSEDRQTEAARRFGVSPMTIQTQLVNHGRLARADAPDIAGRGAGW